MIVAAVGTISFLAIAPTFGAEISSTPAPALTEADYQRLIVQNPKEAPLREAYAAFLSDQGRSEEAKQSLQAARRLDPKNARIAHSLGECDLQIGDIPGAVEAYQKAAALQPGEALYHFSLANVFFLFRREIGTDEKASMQEAMRQFSQATELDPLNEEYARAYAETFYGVPDADWAAAEKAWEHYRQITPHKEFACLGLARICLKAGKKDEAREWLEKIHDSSYRTVKEKLLLQTGR
jgi:tetratricopeptide (TPR) repeat protein